MATQTPKNAFYFYVSDIEQKTNNDKRTFNGTAYHGGLIPNHWYWGDLVFDLDNITLVDNKTPVLIEHDRDKRCGFITEHSINEHGLNISGTLLSNNHGKTISSDADEGYPWQMSVNIEPKSIETVETGSVIVNNKTFHAPVTIFRNNVIREVSFCALGADMHTSAQIFNQQPQMPKEENVDKLEQANQRISELEAKLSQKDSELKAFKQQKRNDDIAALAKKTGKTFSDDEIKQLQEMDDTAFKFASSFAEQSQPKLPEHLFSEQATNGRQVTNSNDLDANIEKWANQ